MSRPLKIFLSISIPLLLLDWITKAWIRGNLAVNDHIMVIEGAFRIWHRTNKGAAWSLFGDQAWGMAFLILMGFVAVGVMIWMVIKLPEDDGISAFALGSLAGGAVGNLLDRIRFREVTDFLDVYADSGPIATFFTKIAGGKHYPTFNVADMAIVAGAILLALLVLKGEPKEEEKDGESKDEAAAA
ncbi:MAG: signal peptidase II [Deltaproteobacteria bacterium]|nr:signal peptidase II [Deltaproteobacteria bacterium]